MMQLERWLLYGFLGFFSTLAVYNGQRLFKADQPTPTPWLNWVKAHEKAIFLIVVASSLFAGIIFFWLVKWNAESMAIMAVGGLVSLFYIVRISGRNLREVPYIKIHLIALTWSIVLIIFPGLNEGIVRESMLLGATHYLYVLAVTIPFDIRDMKYDAEYQKTIPQVIGVNASKAIGVFLLSMFTAFMLLLVPALIYNPVFYIATLAQTALVIGMNDKYADIYCAGVIDGAIALLGLSYFLYDLF